MSTDTSEASGQEAAGRSPNLAGGSPERGESFWDWIRVRARLWGFLAFLLLVVVLFRHVILPFVLALLVAYVLLPVLHQLERIRLLGRRPPRVVWVIVLYAALIGLSALFVTAFVPRVAQDVKRVVRESPALIQTAKQRWVPGIVAWTRRHFGEELVPQGPAKVAGQPQANGRLRLTHLPQGDLELSTDGLQLEVVRAAENRWIVRALSSQERSGGGDAVESVIVRHVEDLIARSETKLEGLLRLGQIFFLGLFHAISMFILVLMISAFLLMDTERIVRSIGRLVPDDYRGDYEIVVGRLDRALGAAIRGQLLICVINAILTGIGLTLFGVKYAILLALLAGVMSLIPIFGSILSSIPIVLVAFVSGDTGIDLLRGVAALGWIIGIHLVEANFLNPKIIGQTARIHPVVVIFAVVAGQSTYGAMGALLAVPIVSAIQTMFLYIRGKVAGEAGV